MEATWRLTRHEGYVYTERSHFFAPSSLENDSQKNESFALKLDYFHNK